MGQRGPLHRNSSRSKREERPILKAAGVAPAKPQGIGKQAGEYWDRTIIELRRLGRLDPSYREALRLHCEQLERRDEWRKVLSSRHGFGLIRRDGMDGVHPLLQRYQALERVIATSCKSFGLTPQSFERVSSEQEEAQEDSALLKFIIDG